MAALDKTYTDKWSEYQDIQNWAIGKIFIMPNGSKLNINRSVFKIWKKEDFNGEERPVMNTSWVEDYYLIKYCPLKFVQDRLKSVYDKEYYESVLNGTSDYDTFTKEGKYGTRIRVIQYPANEFGKHNKAINCGTWDVDLEEPKEYHFMTYFDKENIWAWPDELVETQGDWVSSCCMRYKTIKAIRKAILKWKLPKGTIVKASGRYIGDEYKFLVY